MSVTTAAATPSRHWTTPRLLQTAVVAVWIAAVLFFLAALTTVRASRSLVQTIGKDAVPSIIAAEKLKVSLSDLDANVVNELIVPPGTATSSIKGYDDRRQEITGSLIHAAENITYGDSERKPITDLTNALSAYERLASKAQTLHNRGDEAGTTATYRFALAQLHDNLLPAADALAKANTDAMNDRSAALTLSVGVATTFTMLTGLALLVALVGTQAFLSRRMRRTFNLPLLAATLGALVLLGLLVRTIGAAEKQVRIARDDAFASLSALWQARAVAYDANSDESRWLFDREQRPALEKAFFDKSAEVLKPAAGMSYASMTAASSAPSLPAGSDGFLAKELGNITFSGEQAAAQETVRTYGVYFAKDAVIRADENSGNHAEAVRFDISMKSGDSNWAYSQFDDALGKTIDINQQAFDGAIDSGLGALKGWDILLPIGALIIGGLGFAGVRPRLREYDV